MKIIAVIQQNGVEVNRGEIKRITDICYWRSIPYVRLPILPIKENGKLLVLYNTATCEGLEWG